MLFSSSGIFISQNEKYGLYLYLVWHNLLKTVYEEKGFFTRFFFILLCHWLRALPLSLYRMALIYWMR